MTDIVHQCPPDGSGITPCCGVTPFELDPTSRMTGDPARVTCSPADHHGWPSSALDENSDIPPA
jgi:hypothetical protein